MYEDIFNYQNIDMKIIKLAKESKQSPNAKIINDSVKTVKELQDETNKLGLDAKKQLENFDKFKKLISSLTKEIEEIENSGDYNSEETQKIIKDYLFQLNKIQGNIYILKSNFEKINKSFEEAKIKVIDAKNNHKNAKEKQDQFFAEINGKINSYKKQLKDMESNIDPALLEKFKDAKNDKIYPVFVKLTDDNACGGCRQKLATNELNKLKADKIIVCEHCRRYIVDKE